jgi:hypothetical protein
MSLFQKAWRGFLETRIEEISLEKTTDPEYRRCFNNTHQQFNSLMGSLTPETRKKFEQFDESLAEREGASEDFYYLAGLNDGIVLAKLLIIHEGGNDGNDYLEGCLDDHLRLVSMIARN